MSVVRLPAMYGLRHMNAGLYSSGSSEWHTPGDVFRSLDAEFAFDLDPCPGEADVKQGIRKLRDGLTQDWGEFKAAFVNPPYGRELPRWLKLCRYYGTTSWLRGQKTGIVVALIPARTDTRWWHEIVMPGATEIRFLRGRIGFEGIPVKPERDRQKSRSRAPFPSVIVVFSLRPLT